MKKKDLALSLISARPDLLACPLCRGPLAVVEAASLRCPAGHSFDISSSGYVNLLARAVKSEYGGGMLESRLQVCRIGFFDGLLIEIAALIAAHAPASSPDGLRILDAGCGEGSQLAALLDRLRDGEARSVTGVGADISKDGIRIAVREHPGILWLVADLARLPLADRSVDVILNILSPSNYAEFYRVLKSDGLLIKAVPGEGYLQELRHALYPREDRVQYSNERVVSLFTASCDVICTKRITQAFAVPQGIWPHIVAMTPLAWGAGAGRAEEAAKDVCTSVTLDFVLLAGRKRSGKGGEGNA